MTETVSHIALKKINGANISEYFTILNGIKISADERGCLVIEAPHLSSLAIITNDIVNIISEKQFQWLGRYDNIINTGGIKVSAEEIERKLQPYIKEIFFIAGRADDTLGQIVSLIIETNNVHFKLPNNINSLNKFEKPRQILTMEKFVYTENGKINKKDTLKKLF
jgi:O-succinylbenzoic acid--CoA ligase